MKTLVAIFVLLVTSHVLEASAFEDKSCRSQARVALPHPMETDPKYRALSRAEYRLLLSRKRLLETIIEQFEELNVDDQLLIRLLASNIATKLPLWRVAPSGSPEGRVSQYFGAVSTVTAKHIEIVLSAFAAQWICTKFQKLFVTEWVRWGEPPKNRPIVDRDEKDFLWAAVHAVPRLFDPNAVHDGTPVLSAEESRIVLQRARALVGDTSLPLNFRLILQHDIRFHDDTRLPANPFFADFVDLLEELRAERNRRR